MGFLISKVIELFQRSKDNFKIVLLGLQNAGKTTILYRLSIGQLVTTQPTIGSNVEEISHNNVKFQAWDLGGQESMRSVWDVYYINTDGLIFVIDSADIDNYEDSKNELHKLLQNEDLKSTIILVFANKQDLDSSKPVNELISIYGLDKIKNHLWHIQPCSAKTGEGLMAGLQWLSDQLVYKKNSRFPKNPYLDSYNNIGNETHKSFEQSNAVNTSSVIHMHFNSIRKESSSSTNINISGDILNKSDKNTNVKEDVEVLDKDVK